MLACCKYLLVWGFPVLRDIRSPVASLLPRCLKPSYPDVYNPWVLQLLGFAALPYWCPTFTAAALSHLPESPPKMQNALFYSRACVWDKEHTLEHSFLGLLDLSVSSASSLAIFCRTPLPSRIEFLLTLGRFFLLGLCSFCSFGPEYLSHFLASLIPSDQFMVSLLPEETSQSHSSTWPELVTSPLCSHNAPCTYLSLYSSQHH